MSKIKRKHPGIFLIISLIFVIASVLILIVGSEPGSTYNQISKAPVYTKISQINNSGVKPFIIQGKVENRDIFSNSNNLISTPVNLILEDGEVELEEGFTTFATTSSVTTESDNVSIYSVKTELGVRGYQLFPGSSQEYLDFIWTPFSLYMVFIRVLIGLALLFFILSILINIKK